MAYEVIILYHLHMPCILWEHLLNIPKSAFFLLSVVDKN